MSGLPVAAANLTPRLLLVEDDAIDRMAVRRALAQSPLAGAELVEAADAETAERLLTEQRFDCVLLDHNLPRGSGLTVLQALERAGDDTPVVAMAGQGDEELVVELMKAGATDYIAKHLLKPDRLVQSIRSALLLREARRVARESEQALRDQVEFAELLVGIVSHDLRNPLQAIGMAAAFIERRGELPDDSRKAVARIKSSHQRALRLIRDLLDFTQARHGSLPLRPAPVDLVALAQQVADELAGSAGDRRIVIEGPATLQAEADADRMAQALSNLVANALAYGEAGTPVTLTLATDAGQAVLCVHNRGETIEPERIAVLFEPMRRARHDGPRAGNIGLGLFIVHSIARAHGGDAVVESADGETRVTLRVPLVALPQRPAS
jgi:signal transduction histidine kinase